MTVDIADQLIAPEGKTLEFKRDLSSLKQIMKTVVAFANTAGGTLIIGREDDGSVVGVEDPLMAEEKLSNAIADSILPLIMPDIEIISWERSHLLFIRVSHWPGPFYIKSQGPVDGVYIRLGSTNRKAGPEFIAEIERMQKNKSFDQLPCPSFGIEAIDMPFLQKTFSGIDKSVTENQLNALGILTSFGNRHVVTHGGLILFGKSDARQQVLPDARVSCARFS
jgi:ATP-dependent DNA helicase RecG